MKNTVRVAALFVFAIAYFACAVGTPQTTVAIADSTVKTSQPMTSSTSTEGEVLPSDPKKNTEAGKYVTTQGAYEMWKSDPEKIKIIDCRTPEEYVFVGHAAMAYNIPSKLWTGTWNQEKKKFDLADNSDFEAYAKKKFAIDDTILVMCRSGHRSAMSVNRLTKAGFTNVYNIIDGFEGDKISDEESYFNGKRMKNGWKNSGAPWTYALNSDLIYMP